MDAELKNQSDALWKALEGVLSEEKVFVDLRTLDKSMGMPTGFGTTLTGTLLRETFARTKAEIYGDTVLAFSRPEDFFIRFANAYKTHAIAVMREAKEGKFVPDDGLSETGKEVLEKFDLDGHVERIEKSFGTFLSQFSPQTTARQSIASGEYERPCVFWTAKRPSKEIT